MKRGRKERVKERGRKELDRDREKEIEERVG
jgi:hypothetical protein